MKRFERYKANLKKSHREFLELEKLHDRACSILAALVSGKGRLVKYGLERRHSWKYYYYDEKPDYILELKDGRRLLVEVKAKRTREGHVDLILHTYVNIRHVRNYLKHSREKGLKCYLFIAFFDEEGYCVGYRWFNVNSIEWGKLETRRMWDGNLAYVLPLSLACSPPL